MTVSAELPFIEYQGDGANSIFRVPFSVYSEADISIRISTMPIDLEDETVETWDLVLNTDFTVALDPTTEPDPVAVTSTVTLTQGGIFPGSVPFPLPVGRYIQITRVLAVEQSVSLPRNGPFPAKTIEYMSDYLLMLIQQINIFGPESVYTPQDLVQSVFGRQGTVISSNGDYTDEQVTNTSTVSGANVKEALDSLVLLGSEVKTVHGRTGDVVAVLGDRAASLVSDDSTLNKTTVKGALDDLDTKTQGILSAAADENITGNWTFAPNMTAGRVEGVDAFGTGLKEIGLVGANVHLNGESSIKVKHPDAVPNSALLLGSEVDADGFYPITFVPQTPAYNELDTSSTDHTLTDDFGTTPDLGTSITLAQDCPVGTVFSASGQFLAQNKDDSVSLALYINGTQGGVIASSAIGANQSIILSGTLATTTALSTGGVVTMKAVSAEGDAECQGSVRETRLSLSVQAGGGAGGTIDSAANVGTGAGIYRDITGTQLNLKTLRSSNSTVIYSEEADMIDITAVATGNDEIANEGQNLPIGSSLPYQLYSGMNGRYLQFKTIQPGVGITMQDGVNAVTIGFDASAITIPVTSVFGRVGDIVQTFGDYNADYIEEVSHGDVQTALDNKLELSGGTLTGALVGTTGSFSGAFATGEFTGSAGATFADGLVTGNEIEGKSFMRSPIVYVLDADGVTIRGSLAYNPNGVILSDQLGNSVVLGFNVGGVTQTAFSSNKPVALGSGFNCRAGILGSWTTNVMNFNYLGSLYNVDLWVNSVNFGRIETSLSDERLKTIRPDPQFDTGAMIDAIDTIYYNWNIALASPPSWGLSAQNLHSIDPCLATGDPDGDENVAPMGYDTGATLALLINEVKALRQRVKVLEEG